MFVSKLSYLSKVPTRSVKLFGIPKIVTRFFSSDMQCRREFQIPTRYGFLAAKEWGPEGGRKVIALHGWQDNAGTFDTLIPMLNQNLNVVAIDFCGHGFSSHLPKGCYYHQFDLVLDVKDMADHLKWDNFTILAHSMGAAVGMYFTVAFPHRVNCLISLDMLKPISVVKEYLYPLFKRRMKQLIEMQEKVHRSAPVYTEEAAVLRLMQGMHDSVTAESAKVLMKRGTKPAENEAGVIFTRDIRLQSQYIEVMPAEFHKELLNTITCDLMILRSSEFTPFMYDENEVKEFTDMYKKNCRRFKYVEIEGAHHVHLNNPEKVAPIINEFLSGSIQSNL